MSEYLMSPPNLVGQWISIRLANAYISFNLRQQYSWNKGSFIWSLCVSYCKWTMLICCLIFNCCYEIIFLSFEHFPCFVIQTKLWGICVFKLWTQFILDIAIGCVGNSHLNYKPYVLHFYTTCHRHTKIYFMHNNEGEMVNEPPAN